MQELISYYNGFSRLAKDELTQERHAIANDLYALLVAIQEHKQQLAIAKVGKSC